jgi:hypothetical protein
MKPVYSLARKTVHAVLLCAVGGALFLLSSQSKAASTTLTISGTPASTVAVSQTYSFQPTAKDTVNSRIKFDIYNKPAWAEFDPITGRLWGKPSRRDVGTYSSIQIRLTDWYGFVTTSWFSITVVNESVASTVPPPVTPPVIAVNNAVLDWTPPTENSDGTVLTNLAGYKVHYGTSPTQLTQVINLTNPGLASYVVENLGAGKWYFAVTSYATTGEESSQSGVVSASIL